MASNNPISNPRRIFIFDNPRTCSHLFSKLFANHPELQLLYHPFLPAALYGPERYQQKTKHCAAADEVQREWGTSVEFREWNTVTYKSANRKLVEEIEAAERQNLSIEDEDFYLLTTFRWSRDLYTYLHHQSTNSSPDNFSGWRKPLVIDAYDVVHRTAQLTGKLCREFGLDAAGVQEKWRKLPREEWPGHSVVVAYTRDLLGSGGVERGVGKPLEEDFDIEVETEKWKGEFGEEVGMKLRECVEAEMADYEYLLSFKMEI
ncbi:hypothetical protein KC338_g5131 [Hortaea werneckii]|nr:hypothetical protein KC338_g5131 [Hortaea werneckii]